MAPQLLQVIGSGGLSAVFGVTIWGQGVGPHQVIDIVEKMS
jgi:hypothetical protein